jgi:hypothetical protein
MLVDAMQTSAEACESASREPLNAGPHSLPPALDYDRIMLLLTPRSPSTNSMVRPAGPDKERQRLYRIHELLKLKEGTWSRML